MKTFGLLTLIFLQVIIHRQQFDFQTMQLNKSFKGGFILTHSHFQFRHKHLSLQKQRKDKEIKQQREELEKKRKEFEQTKTKWMKEEVQYKLYSEQRKEENGRLVLQQEKLKQDLFKLAIRRDQIQSRTNPNINIEKADIIKKYLKCAPYTAGKRLESIKFWKSESRYLNLKFLLELAVDRYFGRSMIQRTIISNLSRIVFCKKIKFGEEWIMMCVKQPERTSSHYCYRTCKRSHRSLYHPDNIEISPIEKEYQLIVYAISGKYFQMSKFYTESQLKNWTNAVPSLQLRKPLMFHHRLSVADNLAKINAIRVFSEHSMVEPEGFPLGTQKQGLNSVRGEFKIISEEGVASSQYSELIDDTEEENLSQAASQMEKKVSNEESESSQNPTEENASDSQGELQITIPNKIKTRKEMQQKSWFYIRGKNSTYICKFNRDFLSGYETLLFPESNPLLNIIILKQKNEMYLLQEYIQSSKKFILDRAVARFRLKMKVKAEMKRCLYYKKEIITACYETIMAEEKALSLPCFYMLKSLETSEAHQIYLSCDSLISHPQIENGLQIKTLMHRVLKEKEEIREQKLHARSSNMKNMKNSALRRSQSKRKSNTRNPSRLLSVEHQKSSFSNSKKIVQNWIAFSPQIIQKFQTFLKFNIISIYKRCFIERQSIKSKIFSLIRIQNKVRYLISKRIYHEAKQLVKIKCIWRANSKILVTAILHAHEKKVKLYFERVELASLETVRCYEYDTINWEIICNSLEYTQIEGSYKEVLTNLLELIKQNIDIQTCKRLQLEKQKPQKYKRMIQSFLFMLSLRHRARKNIFFIKKMIIKQRIFVLLIRRDKHVRSLLQCNLYDMILPKNKSDAHELKNSETAFSKQEKDIGSQYGSHKPTRSKPELDDKIYKYQKIYLMQQYFQSINNKQIVDEFYIDKGVFLLKPPKGFNIHYIDRLNTLDLNSEEFLKELGTFEREENLGKLNEDRMSQNLSNHSLKKMLNQNNSSQTQKSPQTIQSREALNFSKLRSKKESKENFKKQKKTSIQNNEREVFTFLKSNFLRENLHNSQMQSKKSFGESNSCKLGRQVFQIKNNSHESVVYYSLYKTDNIFFYLELFIVLKTSSENSYHQELVSLEKYRIYKKQLEQANSNLFYKKLASWAYQNEDQFIKIQEVSKEIKEDILSKKDESISNLVTLEFFNALITGNKRLSFDKPISLIFQKGSRTNTLTL